MCIRDRAEVDAALAEGALEGLRAGDVLIGHEVGQGLDDGAVSYTHLTLPTSDLV